MRSLNRLMREVTRKAALTEEAPGAVASLRLAPVAVPPVEPAVVRSELVHLFEEDFGSLDALRRELVPASAISRKPVPAYVLWRGLPAA